MFSSLFNPPDNSSTSQYYTFAAFCSAETCSLPFITMQNVSVIKEVTHLFSSVLNLTSLTMYLRLCVKVFVKKKTIDHSLSLLTCTQEIVCNFREHWFIFSIECPELDSQTKECLLFKDIFFVTSHDFDMFKQYH